MWLLLLFVCCFSWVDNFGVDCWLVYLTSTRLSKSFPKGLYFFYIPTNNVWGSHFLYSLTSTWLHCIVIVVFLVAVLRRRCGFRSQPWGDEWKSVFSCASAVCVSSPVQCLSTCFSRLRNWVVCVFRVVRVLCSEYMLFIKYMCLFFFLLICFEGHKF